MSTPKELEELQDKRAKLEDESRSLKEEQKNSNKTTRQTISQLESMINELEQSLKQTPQATETSRPQEETKSNSFLKKCASCGKDIPIASEECQYCGTKQIRNLEKTDEAATGTSETSWIEEPVEEPKEDAVTVGVLEDSAVAQQEAADEDPKRTDGKKKGRFF